MALVIGPILAAETLADISKRAAGCAWRDGAGTAGATARRVKHNDQADLSTGPGAVLHRDLLAALSAHPVLQAAARPRRWSRLLVSRTQTGGSYGPHIDNAFMGEGTERLRTDLAFTLFLSEPQTYGGGALVVSRAEGEQSFKLPAGDAVLYPADSVHHVAPVTNGERLVCVGWIESQVRDPAQRALLFDLENVRVSLGRDGVADAQTRLLLDKTFANLLRMWGDA